METVLITGAARRLGRMIAEDLAAAGCFVWIHYHTHEAEAIALREQIRQDGGQCECVRADLTDITQIDAMLRTILDSSNRALTTLINNASVMSRGKLDQTSAEDWDVLINTNLRAVWYLSSRFSVQFPDARRIITIGDASVYRGFAEHAVYGLSKSALKYLTEQMASEYAPRIRVNLLSPGMVLQGEHETPESWQRRTDQILTDNSRITGQILKGIAFLMSDPGLDGSELIIDNGLHLRGKSGNIK